MHVDNSLCQFVVVLIKIKMQPCVKRLASKQILTVILMLWTNNDIYPFSCVIVLFTTMWWNLNISDAKYALLYDAKMSHSSFFVPNKDMMVQFMLWVQYLVIIGTFFQGRAIDIWYHDKCWNVAHSTFNFFINTIFLHFIMLMIIFCIFAGIICRYQK